MIKVKERMYDTRAIRRPIVLLQACFCLFLRDTTDDNDCIVNQTYLSIEECIAGLSPKGAGRENKLDDISCE
jgi:hypothetical protein